MRNTSQTAKALRFMGLSLSGTPCPGGRAAGV